MEHSIPSNDNQPKVDRPRSRYRTPEKGEHIDDSKKVSENGEKTGLYGLDEKKFITGESEKVDLTTGVTRVAALTQISDYDQLEEREIRNEISTTMTNIRLYFEKRLQSSFHIPGKAENSIFNVYIFEFLKVLESNGHSALISTANLPGEIEESVQNYIPVERTIDGLVHQLEHQSEKTLKIGDEEIPGNTDQEIGLLIQMKWILGLIKASNLKQSSPAIEQAPPTSFKKAA